MSCFFFFFPLSDEHFVSSNIDMTTLNFDMINLLVRFADPASARPLPFRLPPSKGALLPLSRHIYYLVSIMLDKYSSYRHPFLRNLMDVNPCEASILPLHLPPSPRPRLRPFPFPSPSPSRSPSRSPSIYPPASPSLLVHRLTPPDLVLTTSS